MEMIKEGGKKSSFGRESVKIGKSAKKFDEKRRFEGKGPPTCSRKGKLNVNSVLSAKGGGGVPRSADEEGGDVRQRG